MLLDELELFLPGRSALDQGSERPQVISTVRLGNLTGLFDGRDRMLAQQGIQADQNPDARDAALRQHRLRPARRMRADQTDLAQEPFGSPFHAGDLLVDDVCRLRAEPPGLVPGMDGDLLQAVIKDPDDSAVPARPDVASNVLGWRRVVRLINFHMAVAVDAAPGLLKTRKALDRQRQQRRTFHVFE